LKNSSQKLERLTALQRMIENHPNLRCDAGSTPAKYPKVGERDMALALTGALI
jgi:hypothetical protein